MVWNPREERERVMVYVVRRLFCEMTTPGWGGEERCDDLRTDQVTAGRQNNLPGYFPSPCLLLCSSGQWRDGDLYFTPQVAGYNSINYLLLHQEIIMNSFRFMFKFQVHI